MFLRVKSSQLLKKILFIASLSVLVCCQSKTQEILSESDAIATDTVGINSTQSPKALNKQIFSGGFLNYAESKNLLQKMNWIFMMKAPKNMYMSMLKQ